MYLNHVYSYLSKLIPNFLKWSNIVIKQMYLNRVYSYLLKLNPKLLK